MASVSIVFLHAPFYNANFEFAKLVKWKNSFCENQSIDLFLSSYLHALVFLHMYRLQGLLCILLKTKQAIYNACLLLILQQEDEEVMKFSCPSTFSIMHFGIFDSVKKVASGRLCISRSISVPGIPSLEAHTACIGLFHFLGRLHIDCYYSTSKPLKLFFFLPFFVGFHCKIRACFFNFG
ncbi:hypothetical protein T4B_10620 [Trichinella pseudospiralis]|uniref:Uncharacterized protein n=1 Tax=Trichinella pseudospiralis TaxID=6337 RepID=A0A0V1E4D8_TRIPS|nr:hypothetical protein T4A_8326 [Trichinella pseudospiralis]KRZ25892.1 hypothetical protein T4B_10620 [Trichinella pseudospiralis]